MWKTGKTKIIGREGNPQGSLLIWSVVMGMTLMTVFFFSAQRLSAITASQRKTTEQINAEAFMESYAGYLQALSPADILSLKGSIDYQGIKGTLTNEAEEITGILDMNEESDAFVFDGGTDIKIEWNLCSDNFKSGLILNDGSEVTYLHDTSSPSCAPAASGYDDEIPLFTVNNPFTLKNLSAPFHYRISPSVSGELLATDQWQLDLQMTLESGKEIKLSRTFDAS